MYPTYLQWLYVFSWYLSNPEILEETVLKLLNQPFPVEPDLTEDWSGCNQCSQLPYIHSQTYDISDI